MGIRQGLMLIVLVFALPIYGQVEQGRLIMSDVTRSYDLTGEWFFKMKDDPQFKEKQIDEQSWILTSMPSEWHERGFIYDGIAWYRFHVTTNDNFSNKNLSLVIPHSSHAYEVFFNGHLVGTSGIIGENAEVVQGTSRSQCFEIPAKYLEGTKDHIVAFRFRSREYIGGIVMPEVYMGEQSVVEERYYSGMIWDGAICGIFGFVALSHIITYLGRRKARYYLYFSGLALGTGFLMLGLETLSYFLWDNFLFNDMCLHYSLLVLPSIQLGFLKHFLGINHPLVRKFFFLIALIFGIFYTVCLFQTSWFRYYPTYIVPVVLVLILVSMVYCVFTTTLAVKARVDGARFILLGYTLFGLAVLNDVGTYFDFFLFNKIFEEGFLALVICFSSALSFRFSQMHKDLEGLNTELAGRFSDLQEARKEIEISEMKYRTLVDGSPEILFSLDESGTILMMNKSIKSIGYKPQNLVGKSFFGLIHRPTDLSVAGLQEEIARLKLQSVLRSQKEETFRIDFTTPFGEPRELVVKLQHTHEGSSEVVFGRAYRKEEDELARLRVSERQKYILGNYITLAETLSFRLASSLSPYLDEVELTSIRISLREILINAIEHGNLAINFDDKTKAQANGNYLQFILERQHDAKYRDRKVTVEYSLNPKRVVFIVTDEGDGFDHRSMLDQDIHAPINKQLMHGRGLFLVRGVFTKVQFNEKGNRVKLLRKFTQA